MAERPGDTVLGPALLVHPEPLREVRFRHVVIALTERHDSEIDQPCSNSPFIASCSPERHALIETRPRSGVVALIDGHQSKGTERIGSAPGITLFPE